MSPGDVPEPEGTDLARALLARARAGAGRRVGGARLGGARTPGRRRPTAGAESGWSGSAADDRDPQPLGAAVDRLAAEHGWSQELAVHAVIARWDQLVGPDLAAHVRPERYAEGQVWLRADSTAWATQVRLLAPVLLSRLNAEIGAGTVARVHVDGPHAPSWRRGLRSVKGRGPRDTYG